RSYPALPEPDSRPLRPIDEHAESPAILAAQPTIAVDRHPPVSHLHGPDHLVRGPRRRQDGLPVAMVQHTEVFRSRIPGRTVSGSPAERPLGHPFADGLVRRPDARRRT